MAPRVTALAAEPHGRVRVELDGEPWRTVPATALLSVGVAVGEELDRARARALRRELRRLEALSIATGALGRRDHSSAGLSAKLERRGVAPAQRAAALTTLERAGYVDDARFAAGRATLLAARGYGDDAIRFDLERHGVDGEAIDEAVHALASEYDRAAAIVERSGRSATIARRLTARGFAAETVESLLA